MIGKKYEILNFLTYLLLWALSGTFVQIDVSLLEDDVGVTTTNSLDRSHGEHDFSITVDVRAHDTKNVLELLWNDERLKKKSKETYIICSDGANNPKEIVWK